MRTPYYLIDEKSLLKNLQVIQRVRETCGAKSVLALKCFSTWCVFDLMSQYMDGTTSSSVLEARLGYEKFGKEVHAFSVGFSHEDILEVREFADKVIFNSVSQFEMYAGLLADIQTGIRLNPGMSYSHYDLADPSRRHCRLGVIDREAVMSIAGRIDGVMFHFNCENDEFENIALAIDQLSETYGDLLAKLEWVSLGGGISFTKDKYPLDDFCAKLKEFSQRFGVQVYLEPGEAAITQSCELVTTVLDVVHNEVDVAIVDASLEAHMLDHLIYRTNPKISLPGEGTHEITIAGRSCLAGDVFGVYKLKTKLSAGDEVRFADAAGYTMVKKNWFNGLPMPSIVVRRLDGTEELVREFSYDDFKESLS